MHVFYDCIHVKSLCEKLQTKFQNILPSVTPLAAILELTNETNSIYNLLNHVLLVFKYYFLQVKRETHTEQKHFNRQPNTNKEKRKTDKPC